MALSLKTNARTTEAPTCENRFSHIVGLF